VTAADRIVEVAQAHGWRRLPSTPARQTNQILGCSLFCHSAGEVMSVVQMAMIGQVPYQQVRDTIFTHPTMAESLNLLFAGL
jgi:pyruvate/2-oxoglutarate dehydrogenase complex dihydrolipoamide dehydrogenase (E3) component